MDAGITAEVRIVPRIAVEAGALYRPLEAQAAGGYVGGGFSSVTDGNGWQFPILAKLRLFPEFAGFRPFLLAGPSLTRTSTTTSGTSQVLVPGPTGGPVTETRTILAKSRDTFAGVTSGGGIEKKIARIRFTGDARATFWYGGHFLVPEGYRNVPAQVMVLFGIGF